jgi:cbb3-type cytochrome oxidase subunit 3
MMRQVMENAGLVTWPLITLVIFFLSSLVVGLWVWRRGSKETYDHISRLPFEDGQTSDSQTRSKA